MQVWALKFRITHLLQKVLCREGETSGAYKRQSHGGESAGSCQVLESPGMLEDERNKPSLFSNSSRSLLGSPRCWDGGWHQTPSALAPGFAQGLSEWE